MARTKQRPKSSPHFGEPVLGPDERLTPAKRVPKEGTKTHQLYSALSSVPTPYGVLWRRAGFDRDPFLRDALRKLAKGGFILKQLDSSNTEFFSIPRDPGRATDQLELRSPHAASAPNAKSEAYRRLVLKRKTFRFTGLLNPSQIEGGRYDCDHVEPWAQWMGNLDAEIMLVGKDFGGKRFFLEFGGQCDPHSDTNRNLSQLFRMLGIDTDTPDRPSPSAPVFLTNSVFGLIDTDSKGGNTISKRILRENAEAFLRPLIDIVDPTIVICMGREAYIGVCMALRLTQERRLADAVGKGPFIAGQGSLVFPVFHCGGLGLANRCMEHQRADWRRIGGFRQRREDP